MANDSGRSGVAVGLSSDDGAASVSALRASIPNAGDWIVVDSYVFEVWRSYAVTARTVAFERGRGRRNGRADIAKVVFFSTSEMAARKAANMLKSMDGEYQRRVRRASLWRRQRIADVTAQAIEARRAETGTGSVHESAVAKPCAQPAAQPSVPSSQGPSK